MQDVHDVGVYEEAPALAYWPALVADFFGRPFVGMPAPALVIRSERAGIASLADEIRQTIWSVDGTIPVTTGGTMQNLYATSLARTSFALVLLAIAGGMALVLGIIGIYGVIAYVVSQRTREIGIRAALGAEPRQLARMFLLQGLTLGAVGAVVGTRGCGRMGTLDAIAAIRRERVGSCGLSRRGRRHRRGNGGRELPARAARGGDRSNRDAEAGVTATETRRSFHIGGSPFVVRAFTLSGRWRARLI